MAFQHTRVEEIETHTAQYVATNSHRTPESYEREVGGGLLVGYKLADLCDEVRKIDTALKFGITDRCKIIHRSSLKQSGAVQVPMECWVYIPGDEFALLRIGYADYNVGDSSKEAYSVYARTIRNEKYGVYREQYHMNLSESLERSMRSVKKYLRPYHTPDIAEMSAAEIEEKVSDIVAAQDGKFSEAKKAVVYDASFINEMRALVDNNHAFVDTAFGKKVVALLTEHEELKAKRNAHVHGHFVLVRSRGGRQVFDVIRVTDMRNSVQKMFRVPARPTVTSYTQDDLPQDIAQKLAALSMLKDDSFIENLGFKVSSTSYWVID
jgi:hypothetical protein